MTKTKALYITNRILILKMGDDLFSGLSIDEITVLCMVKECAEKPFTPDSLKKSLNKRSYETAIENGLVKEKEGVVIPTRKGDYVHEEYVRSLDGIGTGVFDDLHSL